MRKRKYFFGKVNLYGDGVENREKALWEALQSPARVSSSAKYVWSFVDVDKHNFDDEHYYSGALAKITDEELEEMDWEEHKSREMLKEDMIVAKARFLVHAPSGVIAYHQKGAHIDPDMFRKYFALIVTEHYQGFFVDCDVRAVGEFEEFEKRLRRFSVLEEIDFEVHRTNPGGTRTYRDVEEDLRYKQAKLMRQGWEAAEGDSLNIDEDMSSLVRMVSDGYGKATATGEDEKEQRRKVSSEDDQEFTFGPLEVTPRELYELVRGKFSDILDRIGH